MPQPNLGPIVGATLLTQDIEYACQGYEDGLGFELVRKNPVPDELIELWQTPSLQGAPMAVLAASNGQPWLRIIEDIDCIPHKPLKTHGWMSLETNVRSVDCIRQALDTRYFDVIGEPAYLQVSDAIKAMQVIGPANEVSYITQVDSAVPPFELPMTNARTGNLFIPVLCTPDRDKSLAFYESLNLAAPGLKFDTKVTVLNQAWRKAEDHQYPVATLQLAGNCLFEIDEVPEAQPIISNLGSLPSGIALVTCLVKNLSSLLDTLNLSIIQINDSYYPSRKIAFIEGPAGEKIELVEEEK
jgi:catechol 2,3-dioxygenase-like lactoylglutathione lyase family enzyme